MSSSPTPNLKKKSLKGINLYQKLPISAILGLQAHIFKAITVKFSMKVRTWDFLPMPNFVKINEGDIPLWGKFILKITSFGDFGSCKLTYSMPQWLTLA